MSWATPEVYRMYEAHESAKEKQRRAEEKKKKDAAEARQRELQEKWRSIYEECKDKDRSRLTVNELKAVVVFEAPGCKLSGNRAELQERLQSYRDPAQSGTSESDENSSDEMEGIQEERKD